MSKDTLREIDEFEKLAKDIANGRIAKLYQQLGEDVAVTTKGHILEAARKDLEKLLNEARENVPDTVDRLEVVDDTGRAYVKGSIYGTPVKVQLSYQDDNRTLKVFVSDRTENE